MRPNSRHARPALLAASIVAVALAMPAAAAATVTCARYASPSGSDANAGTASSPYRTVAKLAASTPTSATGCLDAGTYGLTQTLVISRSSITLTSTPGQRATVKWTCGATACPSALHVTGSSVVLSRLTLSNAGDPGVTVWLEGASDQLQSNDIGNGSTADHTGIGVDCVFLDNGSGMVINGNRIHDCGSVADGQNDQGVYIDNTVGAQVTNNTIWSAAGFGIQLWPEASRSYVTHNTLDGNGAGVIFAGDNTRPSSGNTVDNNIVADSFAQYDLQHYWEGAPGTGNVASGNCLWNGKLGTVETPVVGYTISATKTANPLFVNPGAHDYRLQSGSPCAGLGASN